MLFPDRDPMDKGVDYDDMAVSILVKNGFIYDIFAISEVRPDEAGNLKEKISNHMDSLQRLRGIN